LRTLSLCTCCRHYPGAAAGRTASLIHPSHVSLPRKGCRVGLRIVLFEDCSAFTRVTACTLALSPIRDTHSEGFSYLVTSIAAPAASGWSGCRVGLAPTGKRRLVTAHTQNRHRPASDKSVSRAKSCRVRDFVPAVRSCSCVRLAPRSGARAMPRSHFSAVGRLGLLWRARSNRRCQ
jgi:hypothetical protein